LSGAKSPCLELELERVYSVCCAPVISWPTGRWGGWVNSTQSGCVYCASSLRKLGWVCNWSVITA